MVIETCEAAPIVVPVLLDVCRGENLATHDAAVVTLSADGVLFDGVDAGAVPPGVGLTLRFRLSDGRYAIAAGHVMRATGGLVAIRFAHANTAMCQLADDMVEIRPGLRQSFLACVLNSPVRVDVLTLPPRHIQNRGQPTMAAADTGFARATAMATQASPSPPL